MANKLMMMMILLSIVPLFVSAKWLRHFGHANRFYLLTYLLVMSHV